MAILFGIISVILIYTNKSWQYGHVAKVFPTVLVWKKSFNFMLTLQYYTKLSFCISDKI